MNGPKNGEDPMAHIRWREEQARKRHPAYVAPKKAEQPNPKEAPKPESEKKPTAKRDKDVRMQHPAYAKPVDSVNPIRRKILHGLGGGAILTSAIAAGAFKIMGSGEGAAKGTEVESPEPHTEAVQPDFPTFSERVERLKNSFTTYRPNYIFLLDGDRNPIGYPIPVVDIPNMLSPDVPELGDADATAVNRTWLAAQYRHAGIPMPEAEEGQALCSIEKMSLIDRIRHFGADPAKGAALHIGHESLLKYVRDHISHAAEKIHDPWVQGRLPTLVPALIGIESNFDNRAVSPTGPRGVVQYTERSWRSVWRMLGRRGNPARFEDQLAFLGGHLYDTHKSFMHAERAKDCIDWVGTYIFENETACKQRFQFPSLMTAYNRGTPVMLDAMEWFVLQSKLLKERRPSALMHLDGERPLSFEDLKAAAQNGHELFYLMVMNAKEHVAGFNEEAAGYFAKMYALEGPLSELPAP